ncbi:Hypothetical_protein [Hexamita inflata]|uniref:Hypothetical_protein n=1 Tax=Hexamita inflata TaxID=28002 RepID=A0AA86TTG9_9EUKA|nr:Hypothetical protein HINF_LOCUS15766 [Hexamita inflata]
MDIIIIINILLLGIQEWSTSGVKVPKVILILQRVFYCISLVQLIQNFRFPIYETLQITIYNLLLATDFAPKQVSQTKTPVQKPKEAPQAPLPQETKKTQSQIPLVKPKHTSETSSQSSTASSGTQASKCNITIEVVNILAFNIIVYLVYMSSECSFDQI